MINFANSERYLDPPVDSMNEAETDAHERDLANAIRQGTISGEIKLWIGDDLDCTCAVCLAAYTRAYKRALPGAQ